MRISLFMLLILICLYPNKTIGQTEISNNTLNIPVLISSKNGSGSGFFYLDSLNIYLVTAKHVVLNPNNNQIKSDTITVNYYDKGSETTQLNSFKISVEDYKQTKTLFYTSKDDVIVLPIGFFEKNDSLWKIKFHNGISYFDIKGKFNPQYLGKEMTNDFDDVTLANDIILLGYPKSLGLKQLPQYDFNVPLIRKGTLAGKNHQNHTFIIDCPSYGGNSGGPVFNYKRGQGDFRVIGIVVSFIPWANKSNDKMNVELDNSGYSVVEPIDKILTLIKEHKIVWNQE